MPEEGAGGGGTGNGAGARGGSAGGEEQAGSASYVFRVRFRVEPAQPEVSVEPASFETVMERAADEPGEPGWRFFRDTSGAAKSTTRLISGN